MTEDTTGLGKSEIAKVLADSCCSHPDWRIAQKIRIALEKAGKGRPSRAATESVGFTCEDPPSRTCRYAGEMTYQVHGAPKENIDAQKVHILSYSIVLPNYDELLEMHIQQKITLCSVGLSACVGPWLSKTEDIRGLGQSKIARILAAYCCIAPEGMIAREIRIALEKAGKGRPSRAATESVGFTCEDPPSRTCRYAGEMTYQVYGAPRENKDFLQRGYMVSYSIVLPNYDEPLEMRIQQIIAPAP